MSFDVRNQRAFEALPSGACQSFLVLDPGVFIAPSLLTAAIAGYCGKLRSSPPLERLRPVLAPGDPELAASRRAFTAGIRLRPERIAAMDKLAAAVGMQTLSAFSSRLRPDQGHTHDA